MFLGQDAYWVRLRRYAEQTVEHSVKKQANAIFPFDKQKGLNGLHFRRACSLEFGLCTKKRH